MHIKNHNWMQIESYLKKDDRIILVLGACEQHGYLSLLTDVKIPMALANKLSEESGVLIAPPLNFGCSPYFLDYPGTISLQLSTYLNVVEDMIRSLYGYGFRRFLILNGHGGNTAVRTHLVELANKLKEINIRWYAWWTTKTVAQIAKRHKLEPQHANWLEAFDFTKVVDLPQDPKTPPDPKNALLNQTQTRTIYEDGSFGGRYEAPKAVMQAILDECLADIIELIKFQ